MKIKRKSDLAGGWKEIKIELTLLDKMVISVIMGLLIGWLWFA